MNKHIHAISSIINTHPENIIMINRANKTLNLTSIVFVFKGVTE